MTEQPILRKGRPVEVEIPLARGGEHFFIRIIPPETVTRGPTVLLVHGASASSNTFAQPPKGGLAAYLEDKGWNVYTLDWRSSMLTADALQHRDATPEDFTLDAAVSDLTIALDWLHKNAHVDKADIAIVAHCVGGALVAQAIAQGQCEPRRVVITTLGLFFRVGVEGWVKGNDFAIDDLNSDRLKRSEDDERPSEYDGKRSESKQRPPRGDQKPREPVISAGRVPWDKTVEDTFQLWRATGLPHGCGRPFCERISFMYGMPFRIDDVGYLHDSPHGLQDQFGSMPLGIYVHCLQNLRRGWAAPFGAIQPSDVTELVNDLARGNFANKRVTLITGNENQVWHRDGIDRMYEWLRNGKELAGACFTKHVLPHYGHQDLYWSTRAPEDVYPKILKGIEPWAYGESTL